jgi:NADPH:quinone reductase-like Zn-dependent oxidoreductase
MSSPTNNAAFFTAKRAPLVVKASTYTPPGENEIVVKNAALAINPFDWILQDAYNLVNPNMKLPSILGTDVAGEVYDVGKGVTRFQKGDRVVAHAMGVAKLSAKTSEGGFQEYTVIREHMASSIPSNMSYETASVMPLGLSTAACAMYMKDFLGLPLPQHSPKPTGTTILIWGGSTSVGCNAIQLAVASGIRVISTSSPKNFDYLKKLGASHVFDYNSKSVVADIVKAFDGQPSAGAISIGRGSVGKCMEVLSQVKGNKFIAQATMDLPPFPKGGLDMVPFLFSFLSLSISTKIQKTVKGVQIKFINGDDLVANEVGPAIYKDFLPKALQDQTFVPAPKARVVGKGLEFLQQGMDLNRKGVSAEKIVVTL